MVNAIFFFCNIVIDAFYSEAAIMGRRVNFEYSMHKFRLNLEIGL